MDIVKNHWEIKGICYWENELSFDGDAIWINIGFHCPFIANKNNFQNVLAVSAFNYVKSFN